MRAVDSGSSAYLRTYANHALNAAEFAALMHVALLAGNTCVHAASVFLYMIVPCFSD